MVFCSQCGNRLEDNDNFCVRCGKAVRKNTDIYNRQIHYEGVIHKCPNCGEVISKLDFKCPLCGFEFAGKKASESVAEFAAKIQQLTSQKKDLKAGARLADVFGFRGVDNIEEQILSYIRNYSVPNTKEDVFEFMVLAASNYKSTKITITDTNGNAGETSRIKARNMAWLAKIEQVYQKARLLYENDEDFVRIREIYEEVNNIRQNEIKARDRQNRIAIIILVCFMAFMLLIVFIFSAAAFGGLKSLFSLALSNPELL